MEKNFHLVHFDHFSRACHDQGLSSDLLWWQITSKFQGLSKYVPALMHVHDIQASRLEVKANCLGYFWLLVLEAFL